MHVFFFNYAEHTQSATSFKCWLFFTIYSSFVFFAFLIDCWTLPQVCYCFCERLGNTCRYFWLDYSVCTPWKKDAARGPFSIFSCLSVHAHECVGVSECVFVWLCVCVCVLFGASSMLVRYVAWVLLPFLFLFSSTSLFSNRLPFFCFSFLAVYGVLGFCVSVCVVCFCVRECMGMTVLDAVSLDFRLLLWGSWVFVIHNILARHFLGELQVLVGVNGRCGTVRGFFLLALSFT